MIKEKVYHLVEKGSHGSKINLIFDYAIMLLIVTNVVAVILETVAPFTDTWSSFFRVFEIISVIIFTFEYLMRIYVSDLTYPSSGKFKSIIRFVFSSYGLIDLVAIMPFYLPFIIIIDLRFIRILRILRFFRILKINRYNNSLSLIGAVIREKKNELLMTGFITSLILLFASFLMYYVECGVQPEKFPNVLASFWWAIATLTTVGYGDVYPITAIGKVISGLIAVLGIGLVALPTGLISAGFIDKLKKGGTGTRCPHCGKIIES